MTLAHRPMNMFQEMFQKWKEYQEICIASTADYFEGDKTE